MKIGFSTNAYTKKSLFYAIQSIAEIGYDGVEIVLDTPHAFLPLSQSKLEHLKKSLKEGGIEVTNLNANTVEGWHKGETAVEKFEPSLSNVAKRLRRWRISYTKRALDLAEVLNSPSVSITSGPVDGLFNNNVKTFQRSVFELAQYAEKRDIKLAIEYEPGLLVGCAAEVFPLLTKDFSNLGINFDVCHSAVLGEDIPKTIRRLGKRIFHTHLSDCKNRKHFHLIPGKGSINFKKIHQALLKVNYRGFLTAELYTYSSYPEKAANETIIYLKKLLK